MNESTVINHIGLLLTNELSWETGPTGPLRDAWVVMSAGRIESVGVGQAPAADPVSLGRRLVDVLDPGAVDGGAS